MFRPRYPVPRMLRPQIVPVRFFSTARVRPRPIYPFNNGIRHQFPETNEATIPSADGVLYSKYIFHSFAYAFNDPLIPTDDDEIFPTPDHRDRIERVKHLINAEMLTGRNPELISTEILLRILRRIYELCHGIPFLKIIFRFVLPFFLCDAVRYIKIIRDQQDITENDFAITEVRAVNASVFQTLYHVFEEQLLEHPEDTIDIEIMKHFIMSPTKMHFEEETWANLEKGSITAGHFWAKIVHLIEHSLESPVLPRIFRSILEVISSATYRPASRTDPKELDDMYHRARIKVVKDDLDVIAKDAFLRFYIFFGSILAECETERSFIFTKMKEIKQRADFKYTYELISERETFLVLNKIYRQFSENAFARYFIRFAITTFLIYVSSSFMTFNSKSMKKWTFKGPTQSRVKVISTDILEDIMNFQKMLESKTDGHEIWNGINAIITQVNETYENGFHQRRCLSLIALWDLISKLIVYALNLERYGVELFHKLIVLVQKLMYLEVRLRHSQEKRLLPFAEEMKQLQP
ncbi:unnamed protein product [Hymenolepis diminuta]|uniref:Uncharacterized protein n=1 Tax=Hymenolepis diminuta TaxID=6216 RepID=A0A564Z6U0_HYMDI|nr:unnamed protein product [Hymenolepis diminuta]